MTYFHSAWIEAQRRRWTRCNAHLWRRADAERFGIVALAPKPPARKYVAPDVAVVPRALAAEIAELRALKQLVADIQLELRIAATVNRLANTTSTPPSRAFPPAIRTEESGRVRKARR
jgi:hypothetical protein